LPDTDLNLAAPATAVITANNKGANQTAPSGYTLPGQHSSLYRKIRKTFCPRPMFIPFLSVYALNLEGGAPWLTGYALGIFGLTQAVLQIPFGMLSDRIGYKR
jgi:MFS family permease